MMIDDEDDTHFCLRCHLTVLGLDNYVAHRKSGCSKPIEPPKSPLPSQLLPPDSFNLKADDFFSSLELQSSAKKTTPSPHTGKPLSGVLTRSKTTAAIHGAKEPDAHSKSGKNVWIGGHQLKLGFGDNQTKLIKAVDHLERRKDEELEAYRASDAESDDFEYEDDESSEEDPDGPPRNHTGGKWKPSSPIPWGWSAPGPSYTGGKWKPPSTAHAKGKEEGEEPKRARLLPPPAPSYTKGKWLPLAESPKRARIMDDSPFRKSSGMVQYWCRPCSRRLASKVVYERHIKSELHFKRTLRDKEFDEPAMEERRAIKSRKFEAIALKQTLPLLPTIRKRQRKTIFVKCDVCNSKVRRNSMGKHLISHYHCRKGDIYTAKAQLMVLDNIRAIVLQSPFQCAACKFYFNHQPDFLAHWRSTAHLEATAKLPGYFTCVLCKFQHENSETMYQHLISDEHNEVLAVINRSMPVIIRKIDPFVCGGCDRHFLVSIALRKHCEKTGHKSTVSEHCCSVCQQCFKSNISLKRHNKSAHGLDLFICTSCRMTFSSQEAAKVHRASTEHRLSKSGPILKKCDYCAEELELPQMKLHLMAVHPEHSAKCPKCGASFALPQQLTVHLRTKSCAFSSGSEAGASSCDKCPFSSSSTADLLFHKVLHSPPILVAGARKPTAQYRCPLCQKLFAKASLQPHLRVHTEERPFKCEVCGKGFVRKNNWVLHVKKHAGGREVRKANAGEARFLCASCGASFKKRSTLKQHMTIHLGKKFKCAHPECTYSARNASELKTHTVIHSNVQNYACTSCEYRGKTLQQLKRHVTIHTGEKKYACSKCAFESRTMSHLKRHLRCHSGAKPYICPHCPYRCNTLENLRKHVLLTSKHKGKHIYECSLAGCPFKTNFARAFKSHVAVVHGGRGPEAPIHLEDLGKVADEPLVADDLLPAFVISRTDEEDDDTVADNLNETWNVVGSYDVEESGALVPFNSVLFQGHF